jgi:hypothetical protein
VDDSHHHQLDYYYFHRNYLIVGYHHHVMLDFHLLPSLDFVGHYLKINVFCFQINNNKIKVFNQVVFDSNFSNVVLVVLDVVVFLGLDRPIGHCYFVD